MAYNYNIPQSTDQLSQSQGQILGNFVALGAIAGNAADASDSLNSTSGFNWVFLATQGVEIPPAAANFPAGTIGLYSASNSTTGLNELYVNKQSQDGVKQIPVTASFLGTQVPPIAAGQSGWTYLPSGLILQWGTYGVVSGTGTVNPSYPIAFPNQILNLQCSLFDQAVSNPTLNVRIITLTNLSSFTASFTSAGSGTSGFFWSAIGY